MSQKFIRFYQPMKMMKSNLCFSLLIILLFIFPLSTVAQQAENHGNNHINNIPDDRIWAQTLEGSHYNEFWNYQFYFDNGIKLHLIYSVANFGSLKSPVSGIRASVYYPDGQVYQVSRESPIERLIQDKDEYKFMLRPDMEMYFIGKLPDEHRVVVNTSKDGNNYDIDITFNNIHEGYMLNDGNFKINGETIGIVTHIPFAEVSGHVSVNDRKEDVTGTAYMDHTHQQETTTRLMDSGFRFVHHSDRNNWDLLYSLNPNGRKAAPVGYMLRSIDGNVELVEVESFNSVSGGRAFGKNIPRIIDFNFDDSKTKRITRTQNQEKYALLGGLGWVAKRAARTFLGGEIIDFRGEAILTEDSSIPKHGEYNFFIVE